MYSKPKYIVYFSAFNTHISQNFWHNDGCRITHTSGTKISTFAEIQISSWFHVIFHRFPMMILTTKSQIQKLKRPTQDLKVQKCSSSIPFRLANCWGYFKYIFQMINWHFSLEFVDIVVFQARQSRSKQKMGRLPESYYHFQYCWGLLGPVQPYRARI